MLHQRRLDFHRADAVSGDVQHIIDSTEDPVVAVVVALRSIAREIKVGSAFPLREVGLDVAVVVAPDRTQHRRPGLGEREQTTTDIDPLASGVEQIRVVYWQRPRRTTCFGCSDYWQRRTVYRVSM